jgi:predicted nucleic acid-binding protein
MKKAETFLLDTMVLINFAERCESCDLFEYFEKVGISFQIVEEVEKEFKQGIKPIGKLRYDKYTKNEIIKVIPNDNIEIDIEKKTELVNHGFGKGELFSSLYFITQDNLKFVSDEKLVNNIFKDKFKINITKTMDLLDILVSNRLITETKKEQIFEEMIKNGFWLKR